MRWILVVAMCVCGAACDKPAPQKPAEAEKAPARAEPAKEKAPEKKAEAPKPQPPPPGSVRFAMPDDGARVLTTFEVAFEVQGVTVVPAGQGVGDNTKGHHHVIVDGGPIPAGQVVPKDATHLHYGKGQTGTQLKLTPGKHKLTMQFADAAHLSYGPALSQTIEVEAVEPARPVKLWFVEPADGAKVKSPVKMKFGLEGYTVRPAMEDPKDHTSGHHHVVVDGKPLMTGQIVPSDDKNIHYGKGQTEGELKLEPGKHTLTLQLADGAHRSYGANASATITVEVE